MILNSTQDSLLYLFYNRNYLLLDSILADTICQYSCSDHNLTFSRRYYVILIINCL